MANKRFRIVTEILVLLSRKVKNMNVKLVLISIFISTTIWTISQLVQPSTREFQVPISYVNPPEGLILLNEPDSVLTVELTAKGWDVLTTNAGTQQVTSLSMSNLKPRLRGKYYTLAVPSAYFKKELIAKLGVDKAGNEMYPDSLFFIFDDLIQKRVPVKANIELQFKSSYSQKGRITLTPDSITISGPASELNEVEYIETVKEELSGLDGSVDEILQCNVPYKNVQLSQQEVVAHIEIDQFTESSLMVPVLIDCNIPGIEIKTYPPEVEVKYQVALKDFENVVDSTFQIVVKVDSLSLLRKDPLIPQLKKAPSRVRNVQLSHETLDFVIIKE